MQTDKLRRSCLSIAVLLAMTWAIDGMSADQRAANTHSTGLTARVNLPDGTTRSVTLDGFGCSVALSSKTFVRVNLNGGSAERIWIDDLVQIKDIAGDSALFVMKDGTEKRVSFVSDFRVLYFGGSSGRAQKLDLSKIKSLQILTPTK